MKLDDQLFDVELLAETSIELAHAPSPLRRSPGLFCRAGLEG
jgi:hypothetical protein